MSHSLGFPRNLSNIAVRDEAKEVRPDARPQVRKNRRRIGWNRLTFFQGRERCRWSCHHSPNLLGMIKGETERLPEERDMSHLATGTNRTLTVEMEYGARNIQQGPTTCALHKRFRHRLPIRFTMTAGLSRRTSPSGIPQMARTCCSNWDTLQTSSV